jgi:hypothetical protein
MAANPLRSSMTSRCRSRESHRRWSFVPLALGLLFGCSATSIDKPGGAGASNSGGAGSAGTPTFGGDLNVTTLPKGRCDIDDGSLRCRKVDCPADSSPSTTSVSGVVYDPAGRVPLYNAVVYVADPKVDLKPLGERVQCESCSAHFPKTGVAAATLTKADGSFRLTDMPVGENVPLIVQLGKWRRVVTLRETVQPCTDTPLAADETRLPRNSTEGNLPKIAVTTGGSDALECLLKKIGVDVTEFSPNNEHGRVNLFSGYRAAKTMTSDGVSVSLPPAEELWASSDRMLDYDMMLMGCEGEGSLWKEAADVTVDDPFIERTVPMQLEVRKYADLGGRIFGSHWHHRWINSDDTTPDDPYPPAGPPIASFAKSAGAVPDLAVSVDSSFPKGLAFRDWLMNVNASTKAGELDLHGVEHSVDSVNPTFARRWIYGTDMKALEAGSSRLPDMVQYFSFTTPVGAPECGRMVFSDVHVSFGGGDDYHDKPFPERCNASPDSELSPQEKALEFMIFDLSSCIQKEDDEVSTPITVVK